MKLPVSYINAIAVSAQKTLIPSSKFNSMIDAPDADEALKILVGGGFGGGVEINGAEDYEKLVNFERAKLKQFVIENALSKDLIYYAYMPADCFNCDVAVRKLLLGIEGTKYSPDGITDVAEIENYVGGNEKAEVPDYVKRTVAGLRAARDEGEISGAKFTSVCLRSLYAELSKIVRGSIIKELIRAEIDAKNISVYFRSGNLKEAMSQYIEGGKISKEKLRLLNLDDETKIRREFLFTPCYDFINLCLIARAEKRPFSEYEKAIDEIPLKRIYNKRFIPEGIVPMLTYYLYKVAEIRNVRTVMSGKLASAKPAQIAERLRFGYGG